MPTSLKANGLATEEGKDPKASTKIKEPPKAPPLDLTKVGLELDIVIPAMLYNAVFNRTVAFSIIGTAMPTRTDIVLKVDPVLASG